jgi:hypothetical protein
MNAVVERIEQPRAVATQAQVTPSQLLQLAMDKGVDLDRLEKLYALQQQWEADQAKKAYTAAMAEFKRNPPEILKDKHVAFQTSKGLTEYDHATLGGACKAAIPALAAVGISHDWDLEQPDAKTVRVTCVLTHSSGHSTRKTLQAFHDESGGKNAIQALGSAVKYLERYTFMAAIGLADMEDDDGAATGSRTEQTEKPEPPEGYETWKADMNAKADEGKEPHLAAWKGSSEPFRIYAASHDRDWWEKSKAKAAKVLR